MFFHGHVDDLSLKDPPIAEHIHTTIQSKPHGHDKPRPQLFSVHLEFFQQSNTLISFISLTLPFSRFNITPMCVCVCVCVCVGFHDAAECV